MSGSLRPAAPPKLTPTSPSICHW